MPELGKYGFYVLSAYGVSIVLLGGLVIGSVLRSRWVRAQLEKIEGKKNG